MECILPTLLLSAAPADLGHHGTFTEIAGLRGVSERTVQRHWDKARIYLRHAVRAGVLG